MKTYQSPVGLMRSPICRWFLEQKWAEAFSFFFQSYSIDVQAVNMFERVSDIMPPTCSFLLQHTLLLLHDICAPLFHFLLIVYIASITISTSLNQVYLLKSTPLRLYANLIAFNSLPLNTSIDWMNVRVSSQKRNLSNYCCFTIYIYICHHKVLLESYWI